MSDLPILSLINLIPLLGAGVALFLTRCPSPKASLYARGVGIGASLLTLLLALVGAAMFDPQNAGFQLVEKISWIPALGLEYHRGVDGLSMPFVLLTAFLVPLCLLGSFSIQKRVPLFTSVFLFLEAMILGVFSSLDFVLFYVFFEGVLIPMFFLIGVWGGERRVKAAFRFFLFTFLGSVLMLAAVIVMVVKAGTSDMTLLMNGKFPEETQIWLWLAFFASFAVKTPLVPFHAWLPYAHVEAPTSVSVILAGVLLKLGGYGFLRVSLQMLPEASHYFAPLMLILGVLAIIYASLVALAQTDMKRLIAYTSIAHMGTVTLGLFSGTSQGIDGAMFGMISHGLVSAGLFLGVGVLYDRFHTREMERFGGVARAMPRYAVLFMVLTLGSIGVPGTSGFVGEFLSLQGASLGWGHVALTGAFGVVLGAAVMLWLYRRVFFGALPEAVAKGPDLLWHEAASMAPLALLIVWLGVFPMHAISYWNEASMALAKSLARGVGGL